MKTRIAIIEDNPESLALMIYLFDHFGYETLAATDGIQGLLLVKEELPDLVICDIQLPSMTGIQIAKDLKIHPQYKDIPIIAVTADSMVRDQERIMNSGFDGYIPKPIDPEVFVMQISHYLKKEKAFKIKTRTEKT